ncbi:response regulator [Fluoribacter dumoffii]|uniref:Staphylococcus exoprotein expression protein R n=1 Tax=Fluoribacter dumoffii TaxID=463 RepID=A0A377G686_9GAMM|nr:response regulator [Fluoribacter dumoffii]KTC92453.1 two-component response regulator [Fluoribacter dumoffii NY 23]MCW8387029.1 response regulator [Fluoribacter dumoffii]MCW8417467.1 response regulator [Fluoribacter dumoffii]MCW8454691.1 response regulator [Fluoribacter dumoffii]MCW8461231.1 response regulator [Fluoribacter dumoffii]
MSHKELKTILYAEDEEDIRMIAEVALENIGGFSVKYCSNGKKALEAAKEYVPDLLLLDVMMPEMDGPTALKELRKNPDFIKVPAIFMTAKIQNNEIEDYKSIGAIDVIKKPFDPLTLAESIKNAWMKYNG